MNNPIGRPPLTDAEIELVFRKLQPFLEAGMSLHKACIQAQVAKSTVYDLGRSNPKFAEKIEVAINHFSVLVNDIVHSELVRISKKQKTKQLSSDELRFIMWTAVTSRATREEFDRKFIQEEDKETEKAKKYKAIYDDPRALKSILQVYERVRTRMIEQGEYTPNPETSP